MTISGVTDSAASRTSGALKAPSELGRDDFLNLLVAQLRYQDPLSPMESADFTAQLAQFSSLEQLTNMNEQLKGLAATQTALNNSQAVSYIGQTVLCEGNATHIADGKPEPLQLALDRPATSVLVSLYDGSGALRATCRQGAMPAGRGSIDWPGNDKDGNALPDGQYWFEIAAVDGTGKDVGVVPLSGGKVSGVAFKNGQATLTVNGVAVRMEDIIEVVPTEPETAP